MLFRKKAKPNPVAFYDDIKQLEDFYNSFGSFSQIGVYGENCPSPDEMGRWCRNALHLMREMASHIDRLEQTNE